MAKILHIGKYYPPDAGGIESVTYALAKGAALHGHDVRVLCFATNPANAFTSLVDNVLVVRAPISFILHSQPFSFWYFIFSLRLSKDADLVHLHTPNMLGLFCAFFLKKNVRLIVHWHSDVIDKGILGVLLSPFEYLLLRKANSIVGTSRPYVVASKTLSSFQDKVKILPIGVVDPRSVPASPPLSANLFNIIAGKRVLLSVGRLVPYKGFDVLIRAASSIPQDVVILIVGSGPLHYQLQQLIDFLEVKDRVILAGRLSDSDLHALFRIAIIYCLPSVTRAEAFGVVLVEAMGYGLPIVSSSIPGSGVSWVNQDGVSGLNVPVGNSLQLAIACNAILNNDSLRRKLSEGARQRYLREFTQPTFIGRMLMIYDQLLV
jgi:glycosyltransferase involved in cell wall biosynthesis